MNERLKRITKVSEMVQASLCEGSVGFYHPEDYGSHCLEQAMELLEPEITEGDKAMHRVLKKHNLDDAVFNDLRFLQARIAYVIGILSGVHLSGRPDLIPKLAAIWDERMKCRPMSYDDNGRGC